MNPSDYEYISSMSPSQQPQTAKFRRLIGLGIVLLVIVVVGYVIFSLLTKPFVKITLPDNISTVRIDRQNADGTLARTTVSESGTVRLKTGSYHITAYKGKQSVGIATSTVKTALQQSLDIPTNSPSGSLRTVAHQHADIITALGDGYLYVDNVTRGVFYTDATGTTNISNQLQLAQIDPRDPTFSGSYSTVIAMEHARSDSVLVSTTAAIFIVQSPSTVIRLPFSETELLDFTSSSYDTTTNRLFLLSTYSKQIYYYDLNKLTDGPKALTKLPGNVNRIVSGGGKVAVVYDDIPSLEPVVLAAYGKHQELAPIIVDGMSGKTLQTLSDWRGITDLGLSGDGRYLLLKKKFATQMTFLDLQTNTSFDTAASDSHSYAWQGNDLYFAYGQSVWRITPSEGEQSLGLIAGSDDPIVRLQRAGERILATTNSYFIADVSTKATPPAAIENLRKLPLQSENYFIAFTALGARIHFDIETPGNTSAFDDRAIAAAKNGEFAKGKAVIQQYAAQPGNSVAARDTSITTPYESASLH